MPNYPYHSTKWAVCYTLDGPSTYGWIKSLTPECVEVIGTTGWFSNVWQPEYVRVVETEEEAKRMYEGEREKNSF